VEWARREGATKVTEHGVCRPVAAVVTATGRVAGRTDGPVPLLPAAVERSRK
jgi:hypothetical protein